MNGDDRRMKTDDEGSREEPRTMAADAERMQILQMIEEGRISAAEGLRLLDALKGPAEAAPPPAPEGTGSAHQAERAAPDPGLERWRRWWVAPMAVGSGIVLISALLMYGAYQNGGFGFWFACATTPFLLGVLLIALAGFSQSARWIHIRVQRGDRDKGDGPRNIALSFPLPIRLTAWVLRTFGHFIPNLERTAADELILALGEHTSSATPLYVDVNNGEGGEKVQVYIG
jgi:hypothetical protein